MSYKYNILLAEDDRADQEIIRRSLNKADLNYDLHIVNNGEELLKYIDGTEKGKNKEPDLILLDLNMPKIDGRQVLEKLKQEKILNRVIIILTTSQNQNDIDFAYAKGVKSFITKPSTLNEFNKMINQLQKYWLESVILPTKK